jgi:hypothetical protein
MSDTNYYDLLKTNDMSQYFSYLNDKFIKMSGPNIRVFKLDKKATVLDDVYGTDRGSRIYLPMFNIRGIYLTNPWVSDIGLEPYGELEQKIKIVVNFDNMVATLRDLKNKHTCDISIECISPNVVPSIQKLDGVVTLFINGSVIKVINLSTYRTVKSFVNAVNSATQFKATYTGVSDEMSKVNDFNAIEFQGSVVSLYVEDTTYDNITEVIEMGDILLTEKWRAYEVKSAMPGGDFGWNYSTFVMEGGLLEMDVLDGLPGNYRLEIEKHQLGQPKVTRE